ncbi:MAG: hypothetical protein CFK52_12445 [Chloracidobacterium sp. CP2_5A]|nr:MAG: hypothetical protein CFK52_12445 [Chloracidobacterium sp. CP2_5A]
MLQSLLGWLKRELAVADPPDPSGLWPAPRPVSLKLALPAGKLNDFIGLGDPYRVLSLLGRPDNPRPHAADHFEYASLGLVIQGGDGLIEYFELIFQPEAIDGAVAPAQATLQFDDGEQLRVSAQTDESAITARFGPPVERDADEDETIARYEMSGRLLEWEFTPQGKVKRLHVELEPSRRATASP